MIKENLIKLLGRMTSCARSGEVFPATVAFKALTSDIITNYAFGESTCYLDRKDYNSSYYDAVTSAFEMAHLLTHFGWLGPLMGSMPLSFTERLLPGMASLHKLLQVSTSPFNHTPLFGQD